MASSARRRWLKAAQYLISLGVAAALLYWAFRGISLHDLWEQVSDVHWGLIGLSLVMGVAAHLARAWRWTLLFHPLGHRPGFLPTFLAVMIAYLGNLAIPRLGEVARCAFLKRKAGIPMASSLGTVVTERLFDLFLLLVLIGGVLLMEFNTLYQFLVEQFFEAPSASEESGDGLLMVGVVGAFTVGLVALWLWRGGWSRIRQWGLYQRLAPLFKKFSAGLLSVRRLQQPGLFMVSTLLMWLAYFGMAYTVVLAFPPTQHLSWISSLTILAVGGLGMAAPVQGGIGAYHLFISNLLLIYGVKSLNGVAFATLMHSSQTLLILALGALSLLVGIFIPPYETSPHATENTEPHASTSLGE